MTVEDRAEIRRLHRSEGMAIKAISRELRISRNAVRRAWHRGEGERILAAVEDEGRRDNLGRF